MVLAQNLSDAQALLYVPKAFAAGYGAFLIACVSAGATSFKVGDDPQPIADAANTVLKTLSDDPAAYAQLLTATSAFFGPIEGNQKLQPVLDLLRQSALLRVWATFEAVAADIWESILNSPQVICTAVDVPGLLADKGETEIDGVDKKMIRVDILRQYGFDLRTTMGTLLRPKFDFTSVGGINQAFKKAFQGSIKEALIQIPQLRELEAKRHVIVHRAGQVDSECVKACPGLQAGTSLTVSEGDVLSAATLVATEVSQLALKLDGIVSQIK